MVKVILVIVVFALTSISIFVSCAPVTQSTASVVDNQSVKTPSSILVDNETIVKPTTLPPQTEYQQKIVFVSLRDATWYWNWSMNWNALADTNYEIYIMDTDGKNQVNLTNNPTRDLMPRLSPDGKKILFVSDRKWEPDNKTGDDWDIFVMDVDGGNVKNLTGNLAWDSMPCWSPDGTMIVFCSGHDSGYCDIWVMDAGGNRFLKINRNRHMLTSFVPTWPAWSPDGKKILYNSYEDATYDLSEMEIDYDMVRQIILNPTPDNYSGQSWSATGNRIVVNPALTATSAANSNLNPLLKAVGKRTLNPTGWDGAAAYSPDGSKIAYVSSRKVINTEMYDVYVMNADGSNPTNLTQSININGQGQYNDWARWSPDGKRIAFVSDRDGKPLDFGVTFKNAWQIYTMNADGSNVTRIINNNYADFAPSWGSVPYDLVEKIKAPPQPTLTISPESTISALDMEQIRKSYGSEVAIEGTVVDYGGSNDVETRPILLYFDKPKQHCLTYDAWLQGMCGTDFRVVIKAQDFKKFPDIYSYLNNKVKVVGKIEYYKGALCIIATDPQQITILK